MRRQEAPQLFRLGLRAVSNPSRNAFQQLALGGMIAPQPPGTPPILFRVNNGTSTSLRPGADPVAMHWELVRYSTVEKLFAFIREAWAKRPDRLEASYDEARGYPTRLCVDPATNVSDDEYGFLITDFKVLSN